jgi:hypothetical protein
MGSALVRLMLVVGLLPMAAIVGGKPFPYVELYEIDAVFKVRTEPRLKLHWPPSASATGWESQSPRWSE